jgi:hypothetical protein
MHVVVVWSPRSSSCLVFHRRAGILCLINEADWELEDTVKYELQDKDIICFVSTLHGG